MTLLIFCHVLFQLSLLRASSALSSSSLSSLSSSSKSSKISSPTIQVYDNILSKKTCHNLHKITSTLGLNHRVFSRNNNNNNNSPAAASSYNTIENSLSSILDEMNDSSPYVEYWSRQEWKNIEAHADIDEHRAKQQHMTTIAATSSSTKHDEKNNNGNHHFRYPTNGHVLYLQVGTDVRGPTCLFPRRRSGGDLLRSTSIITTRERQQQQQQQQQSKKDDDEMGNDNNSAAAQGGDDDIEVVTVPAVPGRLLRFEGSTLHAVPRPSDLWFVSFVSGTGKTEPEDVWGRSVILFNTWDDPPLGVEGVSNDDDGKKSSSSNKVSHAVEGSHDESLSSSSSTEAMGMSCHPRKEWNDVFSMSNDDVSRRTTGGEKECDAKRPMPTMDNDDEDHYNTKAKIWLLGDQRRRDYYGRNIKFTTTEKLKEAIHETHLVSRNFLKQL